MDTHIGALQACALVTFLAAEQRAVSAMLGCIILISFITASWHAPSCYLHVHTEWVHPSSHSSLTGITCRHTGSATSVAAPRTQSPMAAGGSAVATQRTAATPAQIPSSSCLWSRRTTSKRCSADQRSCRRTCARAARASLTSASPSRRCVLGRMGLLSVTPGDRRGQCLQCMTMSHRTLRAAAFCTAGTCMRTAESSITITRCARPSASHSDTQLCAVC